MNSETDIVSFFALASSIKSTNSLDFKYTLFSPYKFASLITSYIETSL